MSNGEVMNSNRKNDRQVSLALKEPSDDGKVVRASFSVRSSHSQAVDRRLAQSGVFVTPSKPKPR